MTITIAGTFGSSYYLGSDTVATVTSSGQIVASGPGPAALYAYGDNTNSWTITNSGTLIGNGAINGVQLGVGGAGVTTGDVTNQTGGTISGSNYGVRIYNLGDPGTTVVNYANATIYGGSHGVALANYGTVNNSGTITAGPTSSGADVLLAAGGVVNNYAGGTIQGYTGVYLAGGGTVTNAGMISAETIVIGGVGVSISGGGGVTNELGGTIQGFQGVAITGGTGTVANYGLISGQSVSSAGIGVVLSGGGVLSNSSTGVIEGYQGVVIGGGTGTVTNYGLIGAPGSIEAAGVSLLDGGSVTNELGATIQGYQGVAIAGASGTVTNAGTITSNGPGAYAVIFSITSSVNLLTVDPGASFVGNINGGTGTIELAAGSPGSLGGFGVSITNFGTLQFDPSAAWTVSANYGGLNSVAITGFEAATTNTIELTGFVASSETYATNAMTLGDGAGDYEALAIQGGFSTPSGFQVTNDGINTFIVDCFALGTRIATPGGAARVEDLTIGDLVKTHYTGAAPVEWIGSRHVDCTRHPDPRKVWPVRVAAGTFGPATPSRDLTLSPNHAVYVNNELIPIGRLINGTSIIQTPVDEITYYHVELAQHDLLLAEGVLAESYLDVGDRSNFGNVGGEVRLFPDFAKCSPDVATAWETRGCAPLLLAGPRLEKTRDWIITLADRAAFATAA